MYHPSQDGSEIIPYYGNQSSVQSPVIMYPVQYIEVPNSLVVEQQSHQIQYLQQALYTETQYRIALVNQLKHTKYKLILMNNHSILGSEWFIILADISAIMQGKIEKTPNMSAF